MTYRMSRVHLAVFVASLLIWLMALGAMATDDPGPMLEPAVAPGVTAVPYTNEVSP